MIASEYDDRNLEYFPSNIDITASLAVQSSLIVDF